MKCNYLNLSIDIVMQALQCGHSGNQIPEPLLIMAHTH